MLCSSLRIPGTPNGKRDAWGLDINEHSLTIRREAGSRKLPIVDSIFCQTIQLPVGSYAHQELLIIAIFANNQITMRCHNNVVRTIEFVSRFSLQHKTHG